MYPSLGTPNLEQSCFRLQNPPFTNFCVRHWYPPIPMFSVGMLIGKHPFQDGQCQDKTALFRAHCQQVPKTQEEDSSAEHRRPHCKQNERFLSPRYAV